METLWLLVLLPIFAYSTFPNDPRQVEEERWRKLKEWENESLPSYLAAKRKEHLRKCIRRDVTPGDIYYAGDGIVVCSKCSCEVR